MALTTEHVWTRMASSLRAFFARRVPDDHLAEDLLQETFVRVHDGLAGLADEERLQAWVFRIARNVLIDRGRRREGLPAPEGAAQVHDPEECPAPSSEANYNAEVSRWLAELIAELPEKYARALALSELEGLGLRDVAERLGLSTEGAKSRLQRGRARLRARLSDCCHLDFDRRGNVVDYERRRGCHRCDGSASA